VALQRSGLPLFFTAAFVLAVSVGIVLLALSPLTDGLFPGRTVPTVTPDAGLEDVTTTPLVETRNGSADSVEGGQNPQKSDVEPEPATPESNSGPAETMPDSEPPVGSPPVEPAAIHAVVRGDTLFGLAQRYWSDPYLWPVLYAENRSVLSDPDLLTPGMRLTVGTKPGDTELIIEAHVLAYARYRELGDAAIARGRAEASDLWIQAGRIRVNNAHWVLYSGLRYDRNLLERVTESVPERDLDVVRGFISRFGPAPGSR